MAEFSKRVGALVAHNGSLVCFPSQKVSIANFCIDKYDLSKVIPLMVEQYTAVLPLIYCLLIDCATFVVANCPYLRYLFPDLPRFVRENSSLQE